MSSRMDEVLPVPGAGERILRGTSRFRLLPFLGPAFVASVAYIDPGNFATNIAGGSKFGYTLVWVIVAANLMAMLIQTLSAKLGIATGRNLPEVCRQRFSQRTTIGLWLQAEAIAMATDLAEFLGAALGFHLLFGIGLFPAALITGATTFGILALQRYGFRPIEAVIIAFVGVISACYVAELWFAHPPLGTVAKHAVLPAFKGTESILLAVGILGATVMPHVIYLHSALMQDRIVPRDDSEARRLYRFTKIDVVIAMSLAGLINMAMLVVAANVFYGSGLHNDASLEIAHKTLTPILGHPERCDLVFGELGWVTRFRSRGWLAQVNASSLLGRHGRETYDAGWSLIETCQADLVGSDGHGANRPPFLDEAFQAVSLRIGSERAFTLFTGAALEPIATEPLCRVENA